MISCHKSSNNPKPDCGCDTDSIKSTCINYDGILRFDAARKAWGVTIQYPSNNSYECKICNTSFPGVKAITDTLTESDSLSIVFTGKLKKTCPDEIDFNYFPEHQQFDIIIDSLKEK